MATANEYCNSLIDDGLKAIERMKSQLEEIKPVVGSDFDPISTQKQVDEILSITNTLIRLDSKVNNIYYKRYLPVLMSKGYLVSSGITSAKNADHY